MSLFIRLVPALLCGATLFAPFVASAYTEDCENCFHLDDEDDLSDLDENDIEPWYAEYRHDALDLHVDYSDPAYELDQSTAWPSEREEFSDMLMR